MKKNCIKEYKRCPETFQFIVFSLLFHSQWQRCLTRCSQSLGEQNVFILTLLMCTCVKLMFCDLLSFAANWCERYLMHSLLTLNVCVASAAGYWLLILVFFHHFFSCCQLFDEIYWLMMHHTELRMGLAGLHSSFSLIT